jgi:hypothetical protein
MRDHSQLVHQNGRATTIKIDGIGGIKLDQNIGQFHQRQTLFAKALEQTWYKQIG